MLDRTRLLAGAVVLGVAFLSTGVATPALAEEQNGKLIFEGGFHDDDDSCLTVKQVEKKLKRMKYKELSYDERYSKEAVYFFVGVKPKRDGKVVVWHLYYDSCERELIAKQSQE